jgi:hypothetical protein
MFLRDPTLCEGMYCDIMIMEIAYPQPLENTLLLFLNLFRGDLCIVGCYCICLSDGVLDRWFVGLSLRFDFVDLLSKLVAVYKMIPASAVIDNCKLLGTRCNRTGSLSSPTG